MDPRYLIEVRVTPITRPARGQICFCLLGRNRKSGQLYGPIIKSPLVDYRWRWQYEEVQGPGVVGEQPILVPGDTFRYTSGAVLKTPVGSMRGQYEMQADDGHRFMARIAPFTLAVPGKLN